MIDRPEKSPQSFDRKKLLSSGSTTKTIENLELISEQYQGESLSGKEYLMKEVLNFGFYHKIIQGLFCEHSVDVTIFATVKSFISLLWQKFSKKLRQICFFCPLGSDFMDGQS